jgi:hypothetical protein
VQIDLANGARDADHLVDADERVKLAMARQ